MAGQSLIDAISTISHIRGLLNQSPANVDRQRFCGQVKITLKKRFIMAEGKEVRIGFIQLFNAKDGLPRHKAGQLFETHAEADLQASLLQGKLKKAYSGVGKVRYRI